MVTDTFPSFRDETKYEDQTGVYCIISVFWAIRGAVLPSLATKLGSICIFAHSYIFFFLLYSLGNMTKNKSERKQSISGNGHRFS